MMKIQLLVSLVCFGLCVNAAAVPAVAVQDAIQENTVDLVPAVPAEDAIEEKTVDLVVPADNAEKENTVELLVVPADNAEKESTVELLGEPVAYVKQEEAELPAPADKTTELIIPDDVEAVYELEDNTPEKADLQQASLCQGPSKRCRKGWYKFENNCFQVVNLSYSWNTAEFFCQTESSNLASVHTLKEYSFLQQLTWNSGFLTAWIGGHKFQNFWRWNDGTPFDYNNWDSQSSSFSSECVYLNSQGTKGWNTQQCNSNYPFICSYKRTCC